MKHHYELDEEIGMDSFMDIVTNVIGIMILIAGAIVINASEITVSLGSPMQHLAPQGSTAVFFNLENEYIVPRNADSIQRRTEELLSRYHREIGFEPGHIQDAQWLNQQGLETEHYTLQFDAGDDWLTAELFSKAPGLGDSLADLKQGNSDFECVLNELHPSQHHVYFIVREDSLALFRSTRALAREKGFAVGWMPKEADESFRHLLYGTGGWGTMIQ